jgi:hypothetical protein
LAVLRREILVYKIGKWGIAGAAATCAVAIGAGVASATVLTSAPKPGNYTLYGCISGSSRTLEGVYTSASAFKACPRGSTAVAFNSTGPQGKRGPTGPAGVGAPQWRAEVDNGAEFSVSDSPNLADTSSTTATYSDAGVVVAVGPVGKLTSAGIAYKGTGPLAENVWIGDGPEAGTPGVYSFSSGAADFCYGLGQSYNSSGVPTSFYMTGSNCIGTNGVNNLGDPLTLAEIAASFPANAEAYVWLGVVTGSGGTAPGTATVKTVAGQTVNATVGVTKEKSGALFSFVSG